MNENAQLASSQPITEWQLKQPYSWKFFFALFVFSILAAFSAHRTEVDRGIILITEGMGDAVGIVDSSDVKQGFVHFFGKAFPIAFAEKTETSRIQNFNSDQLPLGSYIVSEPIREYDIDKGEWIETEVVDYLIEPIGYLLRVLALMLKTIEIAIWGTLLAILIAVPTAFLSARGYSPHFIIYNLARGFSSFNRAIPELISAMFMVLMFGFGAFPGVVALGIHSSGFLGKFFADDIENTDKGPQEALLCIGSSKLQVLRYAVIPQVLPQYFAYVQYILERNVRSATVLGIVGAGGIGMELKGRWDLSDFGHVSTILLVIFITVFLLEHFTQYVRRKII